MAKIKMATGAIYECTQMSFTEETAFITLAVDFPKAAQIFGNASNTRRMEYGRFVLSGWTHLANLGEAPGGIMAILKGGTVTEVNNNA